MNEQTWKTASPGIGLALPKHACHVPGCPQEVHPRLLMCYYHWRMVPFRLKERVWASYRSGQEIDKTPSDAYLVAARAAIDAVLRQIALSGGSEVIDR